MQMGPSIARFAGSIMRPMIENTRYYVPSVARVCRGASREQPACQKRLDQSYFTPGKDRRLY